MGALELLEDTALVLAVPEVGVADGVSWTDALALAAVEGVADAPAELAGLAEPPPALRPASKTMPHTAAIQRSALMPSQHYQSSGDR